MQTDTTNTKPLWKVLNEQRTKGNISVSEKTSLRCTNLESILFFADFNKSSFISYKEKSNNAQYTALAVINFADVVEALEDIHWACMMDSDIPTAWWHKHKETVAKAKQVLNNLK